MIFSLIDHPSGLIKRLFWIFAASLVCISGVLAATLTVQTDTGEDIVLELQSNDSVALTTTASGATYLSLRGFYVAISDQPLTGSGGDGSGNGTQGTGDGGTGTDGTGDGGTGTDGTGDGGTGTDGTGDGGTGTDGTGDGGTGGDGSTGTDVPTDGYCAGYDATLADCKEDQNFDPWIAAGGEKPYWIRNSLTEVFPFTIPDRAEASDVFYGYLHLTTGERKRDAAKEDIFHMWVSESPNGPVLAGTDCEWYGTQAKTSWKWTQDASVADQICFIGAESRTLYMNFETRCYEKYYSGTCNDDNLRKSSAKYQFDVSRRLKYY